MHPSTYTTSVTLSELFFGDNKMYLHHLLCGIKQVMQSVNKHIAVVIAYASCCAENINCVISTCTGL